ncbi:hypothetical protein QMG83_06400 [Salinibacterium sp. G-O1]|uniref:hypothetical protein n=1 Tax=Salinibacterium sp. G-O1 TaxID=3046208 RepID=UPI0024B919EB|nr:hypothetical protein [Salinibacterium sp. G-O1]MDJ0334850.1 hypothetical protein [Salinibacterium sp. G-O1]
MSDSAEHTVEPTGDDDNLESNSLMSQLKVIEDQPLESRAAAFVQVHDRLQRRLEGGDSPASHG